MLLKHYFLEKIAHSSYILAGSKSCAVIDPRRDADIYINEARQMGVRITHILETHLHATLSRGTWSWLQSQAQNIAPYSGKCRFELVAVSDVDSFFIRT
jgi:glyoxylase-like metal-dependent hydrolase (beta-lactamase superfamily II)